MGTVFGTKVSGAKSVHGHLCVNTSFCKQDGTFLCHVQTFVLTLKPCSHTGTSCYVRGSFCLSCQHLPVISSRFISEKTKPHCALYIHSARQCTPHQTPPGRVAGTSASLLGLTLRAGGQRDGHLPISLQEPHRQCLLPGGCPCLGFVLVAGQMQT